MKLADLELGVRYAYFYERQQKWVPAYVIGKNWNTRGEYTPRAQYAAGRGRAVLVILGIAANPERNEAEAKSYTDSRHLALNAIVDALGQDSALDSILFPAEGWTAQVMGDRQYSGLTEWSEYEAQNDLRAATEEEKRRQYRKLRTHMLKALRTRDAQTTLATPVYKVPTTPPATPARTPREVTEAQEKLRRIRKQVADLEVKALEEGAVNNYERAVRSTEAWLLQHAPAEFPTTDAATIAAHEVVLDVAKFVQDEPRTVSARSQHAETGRAKAAMWERWRKGTDGDGYDWLGGEDQDPHHVIDVLLGLLIDRGWRPTEVNS